LAGRRVIAVAAGWTTSLALTADGVWSWGQGGLGVLGHGDTQSQLLPQRLEALAGQRVVAVAAGYFHFLALTADGAVWSWGNGDFGKLGHGDRQHQLLPNKVEAFADQRVVAVSAGGQHSIAITADGAVFTWGEGGHGCLGHGEDLSNQRLPKKIEAFGRRGRGKKESAETRACELCLGTGASALSILDFSRAGAEGGEEGAARR